MRSFFWLLRTIPHISLISSVLAGKEEIPSPLVHFVPWVNPDTHSSESFVAAGNQPLAASFCVFLSSVLDAHDSENRTPPERDRRGRVLAFCRLPGAHRKTPSAQRPLAPGGNSWRKSSGKRRAAARACAG